MLLLKFLKLCGSLYDVHILPPSSPSNSSPTKFPNTLFFFFFSFPFIICSIQYLSLVIFFSQILMFLPQKVTSQQNPPSFCSNPQTALWNSSPWWGSAQKTEKNKRKIISIDDRERIIGDAKMYTYITRLSLPFSPPSPSPFYPRGEREKNKKTKELRKRYLRNPFNATQEKKYIYIFIFRGIE